MSERSKLIEFARIHGVLTNRRRTEINTCNHEVLSYKFKQEIMTDIYAKAQFGIKYKTLLETYEIFECKDIFQLHFKTLVIDKDSCLMVWNTDKHFVEISEVGEDGKTFRQVITLLLYKNAEIIEIEKYQFSNREREEFKRRKEHSYKYSVSMDKVLLTNEKGLEIAKINATVRQESSIITSKSYKKLLGQSIRGIFIGDTIRATELNYFEELNPPIQSWKEEDLVPNGTVGTYNEADLV